jgi:hypothetical protein
MLIAMSDFVFSQQRNNSAIWHLIIADSATSKGIDRVTVSINRVNNFAADINGVVNINKNLISTKDTIKISAVGYTTLLIMPGITHKFPDTVRLPASVTSLKEVKINSFHPQITLGNIKKSYKGEFRPVANQEFAEYIPNEKKITGTITSVEYAVNDVSEGIEMPFMMRLYSKSKESMYPDTELIKDSIIVYNPKRQRLLSIDISKYNIQFPEDGLFVVFETLSPSYYSKDVVWFNGRGYPKTPGISGDYIPYEAPIDFDEKDRKGAKYSLWRIDKAKWEPWTVLAPGIVFAMGVTITPN